MIYWLQQSLLLVFALWSIGNSISYGQERNIRPFIRADANVDGKIDISDSISIISYLINSNNVKCEKAMDVNDSAIIDISDAIFLINYLFLGGIQPAEPFPMMGVDVSLDELSCEKYFLRNQEWENIRLTFVTDTPPPQTETTNISVKDLGIASSENGYAVVWIDPREGSGNLYLVIVDGDGQKLSNEIKITDYPAGTKYTEVMRPRIVGDDGGYAIFWRGNPLIATPTNNDHIFFARFDLAGKRLTENISITPEGLAIRDYVDSVWDGDAYGVVWAQRGNENSLDIYFARVDNNGNKLTKEVIVFTLNDFAQPKIIWTGSEYGIAWWGNMERGGERKAYFARMDLEGNLKEDVFQLQACNDISMSAIVWDSDSYNIFWVSPASKNFFRTKIVVQDNCSIEAQKCSLIGVSEYLADDFILDLDIFWSGYEYAIVYSARFNAKVLRLDIDGNLIDISNISDLHSIEPHGPKIVMSKTKYGICWIDRRDEHKFSQQPGEVYFATGY